MDLYIFIHIDNQRAVENQAWTDKHKKAVYNGIANYNKKGGRLPRFTGDIQNYVDKHCVGSGCQILFEYHRKDNDNKLRKIKRSTLNDIYKNSDLLYECLKKSCRWTRLKVSIHGGV